MSVERLSHLLKRAGTELSRHGIAETELPWRKHRTPYRVFLAEMLLVRTRADVVARLFEKIVSEYPTIEALASADENGLRETLRPLGLSKRVSYIIGAARYICEKHNGEIPDDYEALLKVPGIGTYTAAAILTFAHGKKCVPADVNVIRFVSRLTGLKMDHRTKGSPEIRNLLPSLLEADTELSAETLLDFSRLVCRARNPRCGICPLTEHCSYFRDRSEVHAR